MEDKLLAELEDVLDAYGYRLTSSNISAQNNVRDLYVLGVISKQTVITSIQTQLTFTAEKFGDGARKNDTI